MITTCFTMATITSLAFIGYHLWKYIEGETALDDCIIGTTLSGCVGFMIGFLYFASFPFIAMIIIMYVGLKKLNKHIKGE